MGGSLYGTYLIPRSASDLSLYGVGASLTLFQGGEAGLYFMGGVEGGTATNASESVWSG